MVFFRPEHDFLFKSVSSYCALILDFCQPICSLWKWTRSVPVKKWWETTMKKTRKKLIPTKRAEMNPNHFWIIFLRICMSKKISTKYWSPKILLRICLKIKILNPRQNKTLETLLQLKIIDYSVNCLSKKYHAFRARQKYWGLKKHWASMLAVKWWQIHSRLKCLGGVIFG